MKRLIAAPPSQGIRVRNASPRGEGPTSVHVIDDGSRGYPSYGLLVAVERRGERYVPSSSGSAVSPHPLGDSVFCVEIHDHAPPYPINVPQGRWPSGGSATLVLLVYFEVIDAGQATIAADASDARARAHAESVHLRGAPLPADEIGPGSPMWLAVIGAVDKLLGRTRADDLDFGRIEGAPAERSEPRSKERGVAPAVSFALMSCQYPCDILDHMPAGTVETPGPADASLLKLGKERSSTERRARLRRPCCSWPAIRSISMPRRDCSIPSRRTTDTEIPTTRSSPVGARRPCSTALASTSA